MSGGSFLAGEGSAWTLGTEVQGARMGRDREESRTVWLTQASPCFQRRFGNRPSLPDSQNHQAQIAAIVNLRLPTFRGV